jgi:hypothetical protein
MSNVYPYPATVQPLGDSDSGSASAEWVKHNVTLVATCGDNTFE